EPAGEEPEEEEGEEEEEVDNRAPLLPAEEIRRLTPLVAKGFPAKRRPRLSANLAKHELRVVFPYLARGSDRFADHVSYAEGATAFFTVAAYFYPVTTELVALDFIGQWKGKTVLHVHVADQRTFLSMDPWPMRERLLQAGISLDPG